MGSRVYLGRLSHSARERDVESFFKGYGKIREIVLKDGFGFIEFDDARDAEDAVYDLNGKELCGDRVIVEHAKAPGSSRRGDRNGGYGGGGRSNYGGRGYGGGRDSYGGGGRDSYGGGGRYSGGGGGYRGGDRGDRPRNTAPLRTEYRVLIENLSSSVSWQDLKDYMRKAGEVTFADAHKLKPNKGVVEYATRSDMKNAIAKLDNTELNGRKIRVLEDTHSSGSPSSRKRSRSRSHSRSRSRSRSSRSRSRSVSKNRSRSRSKEPQKSPAGRSRSPPGRSRSPVGRNRSPAGRSRSPAVRSPSNRKAHSRSASRSVSKSPDHR